LCDYVSQPAEQHVQSIQVRFAAPESCTVHLEQEFENFSRRDIISFASKDKLCLAGLARPSLPVTGVTVANNTRRLATCNNHQQQADIEYSFASFVFSLLFEVSSDYRFRFR